MNFMKLVSITLSLSVLSSVSMADITFVAPDAHGIKVCQRLSRVLKPKGVTPDACYNNAKDFLVSKDVKVMTGSYEAYFALSTGDKSQEPCRSFLQSVVASTRTMELKEAQDVYGDDKAQSLDRAFYSYQECARRDDYMRAHTKRAPKKAVAKKSVKSKKTATNTTANTGSH